ncbi:DinB family protein [Hyunsoonleella sp. 2307UL5-6]|uniref:DinB family protein n=1 Tax=Hyunsoonleella sp. 2307UL5-6 TaxID=3384768 RepID=UPI0039BD5F0E
MDTATEELQVVFNQLENNTLVFKNLLKDVSQHDYLWRPESIKWCLLEIVCHLLDEELNDFRARVKHALETPQKPLVPIAPEVWVKERHYMSKDYNEILKTFLIERGSSIQWLKQQVNMDWSNVVLHPELGNLSAELFLRNWLAHDFLHIRQILQYKFQLLKQSSKIDLEYAGNW